MLIKKEENVNKTKGKEVHKNWFNNNTSFKPVFLHCRLFPDRSTHQGWLITTRLDVWCLGTGRQSISDLHETVQRQSSQNSTNEYFKQVFSRAFPDKCPICWWPRNTSFASGGLEMCWRIKFEVGYSRIVQQSSDIAQCSSHLTYSKIFSSRLNADWSRFSWWCSMSVATGDFERCLKMAWKKIRTRNHTPDKKTFKSFLTRLHSGLCGFHCWLLEELTNSGIGHRPSSGRNRMLNDTKWHMQQEPLLPQIHLRTQLHTTLEDNNLCCLNKKQKFHFYVS